jgi:hypothetical protein
VAGDGAPGVTSVVGVGEGGLGCVAVGIVTTTATGVDVGAAAMGWLAVGVSAARAYEVPANVPPDPHMSSPGSGALLLVSH